MQPTNALAATSKPSDSRYEELVRKWLAVFAENASKEVSSGQKNLWIEAFRGIEIEVLDAAFRRTLDTWRITQIPPIGEVKSHILAAQEAAQEVEIEKKWDRLVDYVQRYVNPDFVNGLASDAPSLSPKMEFAAKAAGGLGWLATCPTDRIEWARRNFIGAYKAARELEVSDLLLTGEEAKKLLASLTEKAQQEIVSGAIGQVAALKAMR